MKLKPSLEEFIAITIVFFIITTFAMAAQVQGQEQEAIVPKLSEPLPEEVAPADPIEPPLTVLETPSRVILNPGETPESLVKRTDAEPDIQLAQVSSVPASQAVIVENNKRRAVLRDSLGVMKTQRGQKILLESDILFDFDKSNVKPSADDTLEEVAEFIRLSGDREVEIVGYADPIGNEKYNLDLSWDRAQAIIKHLVTEEGLPKARLRAVGRGEEGAEAPNTKPDGSDNPEGRQQNRRVEILIRDVIDASPEKPGPELN
ncbi:MAG: OmpA family protein [Verrucomicrobiae bacterium]|nr:OmpA family protein [Verrucomicrobiae bacterium]